MRRIVVILLVASHVVVAGLFLRLGQALADRWPSAHPFFRGGATVAAQSPLSSTVFQQLRANATGSQRPGSRPKFFGQRNSTNASRIEELLFPVSLQSTTGQAKVGPAKVGQVPPTAAPLTSYGCKDLPSRPFSFVDRLCGDQHFLIKDVTKVFQVDQSYWEETGKSSPWWGVLVHIQRGTAIPLAAKLQFYKSGHDWVTGMESRVQRYRLFEADWARGKTAFDFGCGLGRMSNALTRLGFASVICADMTSSYLAAAEANLRSMAGQGTVAADVLSKVSFRKISPSLLCDVEPASVDFVHSVITIQHNKPALQVLYVEQFCDILRSGGKAYIGIPVQIYAQPKRMHCDIGSETRTMNMHYTPEKEVIRHITSRGCEMIATVKLNDVGAIGQSMAFLFRKP